MKFIYLVRDPRGVARSRLSKELKHLRNITTISQTVCPIHDLFLQELAEKPKWAKNVLIVRYEDLAANSLAGVEKIYKFVGLQPHPEVDQYLGKTTQSSVETALSWRNRMNFTFVNLVQEECTQVFEKFGYNKVDQGQFESIREQGESYLATQNLVQNLGCLDCVYPQ